MSTIFTNSEIPPHFPLNRIQKYTPKSNTDTFNYFLLLPSLMYYSSPTYSYMLQSSTICNVVPSSLLVSRLSLLVSPFSYLPSPHLPCFPIYKLRCSFPMADLKKKLSATKTIEKKARAPSTPRKDLGATIPSTSPTSLESTPRKKTIESPSAVQQPTGDKFRDKVRTLLCDALYFKDEKVVSTRDEAQLVTNAIEEAMFEKFKGSGQLYKQKYRTISFNLKDPKNGKLRAGVLSRDILPHDLVEMSSTELANEDLRKRRAEVQAKMTRDAIPHTQQEASTDRFKCGKCKQRKCTYYQMQTRSADEPLTTFVSCVNCHNRWRF